MDRYEAIQAAVRLALRNLDISEMSDGDVMFLSDIDNPGDIPDVKRQYKRLQEFVEESASSDPDAWLYCED